MPLQRVFHPALTPLQDVRSLDVQYGWESLGDAALFLLEPPLPRWWVEVRIRGSAEHPATVVMQVDHGTGFSEASAYVVGVLTETMNERRVYVPFGTRPRARLAILMKPGRFTIEDVALRAVGRAEVVARSVEMYVRRNPPSLSTAGRTLMRVLTTLRSGGPRALRRAMGRQLQYQGTSAWDPYAIWLQRHSVTPEDAPRLQAELAALSRAPVFSVLVPVYETDPRWLRRCIESVRAQVYPHWELCLADDASKSPDVRRILEEFRAEDERVRIVFREKNGHIAAASNSALALATGEFVALLDHDDELSVDALFRAAQELDRHPEADLLYSDEDFVDETGRYHTPFFKPDWSPETLLSHMYVSHLSVYRRAVVNEVGGFREGFEGSQDHDLCLRVTERTSRVRHIPRILYHWRTVPGSAAAMAGAKPYATEAGRRAIEEALRRRGIPGRVESVRKHPGHYITRYDPDISKKVSVVIPTRDRADLLRPCLQSVFRRTRHPNFDVCVVDNGSRESETLELFAHWLRTEPKRFQVLRRDEPFNFAKLINAGVAATNGELLLLLNNDTRVLEPRWLEEMAGYAQRPEIACVGCKLLYPDATVQHGGVFLLSDGRGAHSHQGAPAGSPGYFGRLLGVSNYAAVTGACLMVRRRAFEELGGLDERLGVACNDIDFCLRALSLGLRNVFLGYVSVLHHESKSRGYEDSPEKIARYRAETEVMRERWAPLLTRDPYYNPNLRGVPGGFSFSILG